MNTSMNTKTTKFDYQTLELLYDLSCVNIKNLTEQRDIAEQQRDEISVSAYHRIRQIEGLNDAVIMYERAEKQTRKGVAILSMIIVILLIVLIRVIFGSSGVESTNFCSSGGRICSSSSDFDCFSYINVDGNLIYN